MHQTLLSLCALGLVVTVIPLVVLQIPDAVAWVVPPRVAAAGPGAVASLLRASGLALPAMAVAGSLAALMVRWLRAGPVLLSGLLILAASWAAFTVSPAAGAVTALTRAGIDLAGLYLPELAAVPGPLVAVLCVPVAGGLAGGAVQLHAIAGTVTAPAARAALAAAAGHWALVAAAVTGAVAVAMACTPGRPGPAASRIMGKLTL